MCRHIVRDCPHAPLARLGLKTPRTTKCSELCPHHPSTPLCPRTVLNPRMSSIGTLSLLLSVLVVRVTSFSSVPAKPLVTSVSHSVPHLGNLKTVCDHSDKGSPMLYVEVDADAWNNLSTVMTGLDESIPVPPECPPFKSLFFSFAVGQSHPPWDGRQFNGEQPGGYAASRTVRACAL